MNFLDANGARVPALGFGTWRLRGETAERMVATAMALGYRHIDTAQMYDNEREVGRAIAASGVPRDEIFVTTKVWPDRFRAGVLEASIEESLRRLGLDYVDLVLLHWPNSTVPLAETVGALNAVQAAGMTRHIGVSNFNRSLVDETLAQSAAPIITNQVEYHPYLDQRPLLEHAARHGYIVTAYTPLAKGKVFNDPVLARIGARHGKSGGQVALRWLLQQGVSAIPRTSSERNAAANFDLFDFELSDEEMSRVGALSRRDGRLTDPDGLAPTWD